MNKKTPLRKCVACGNMFEKDKLFRIVRTCDGIQLDMTQKAQGRGAYICKNDDILYLDNELFTYENKEFAERYTALYRDGHSQATTTDGNIATEEHGKTRKCLDDIRVNPCYCACFSPQTHMAWKMSFRSFALSDAEYSTCGGISLNCVRVINPRSSKSLSVVESTVLLMPGMALRSSPKRMVSCLPSSNSTQAFHLP